MLPFTANTPGKGCSRQTRSSSRLRHRKPIAGRVSHSQCIVGQRAVLIWNAVWQIWVITLQKYFPLTPACGECKCTPYFCLPLSPGAVVYLLIEFAASQGVTEMEGERILIFFQRELSAPEDINIWGTWAPSACSHPIHYCLFIHLSYPSTCGSVWYVSSEGVHSSHEPACNGMCRSVCVCALSQGTMNKVSDLQSGDSTATVNRLWPPWETFYLQPSAKETHRAN